MDIFFEQLVTREKVGMVRVKSTGILLAGIFFTLFAFCSVFMFPAFSFFGMFVGIWLIYGTYYLYTSQNVEYEYIITNGELDVDRIVAQRRRKRLLTIRIATWEQFGKYDSLNPPRADSEAQVLACADPAAKDNYYAVFNCKDLGKTMLIFCPNDKLMENINRYVPSSSRV